MQKWLTFVAVLSSGYRHIQLHLHFVHCLSSNYRNYRYVALYLQISAETSLHRSGSIALRYSPGAHFVYGAKTSPAPNTSEGYSARTSRHQTIRGARLPSRSMALNVINCVLTMAVCESPRKKCLANLCRCTSRFFR